MTSPQPPAESTGAAPAPAAPAATTPLTKPETAALQLALRAENAAIWAYALVAANDQDDANVIGEMSGAHLQRRDATAALMTAGKARPVPPAAAYSVPPTADVATARTLAIAIENDCAAAWKGVVGATDSADLRSFAAGGLTEAAVRLVEWKQLAKANPISVPFPGGA